MAKIISKSNKMKRLFIFFMTLIILFGIVANYSVALTQSAEPFAGGTDYSNQVEIGDWAILDSSGNPLSETNEAVRGGGYQLSFSWSMSPNNGETLKSGDFLTIKLPTNASFGNWGANNSSYESFSNGATVLGEWRFNNGKIEVVLNDNVNGNSVINATFTTGKTTLVNQTVTGGIQDVSMGNVTKKIKFRQATLSPLGKNDAKASAGTSNSAITWVTRINNEGSVELTQGELGSNFTVKSNTYFEDKLSGTVRDDTIYINAIVPIPTDLTTGQASMTYNNYLVTSKFTRVIQNEGETYEGFKARLNPLEYGIYIDGDGQQNIVIFFGDIGNNGLKYNDIYNNFSTQSANVAINSGYYKAEDKDQLVAMFEKTYGNSNTINGNVATYMVLFHEEYDKTIVNTTKSNTALLTMNDVSKSLTGNGTLQGNIGSANVSAQQAGVYLFDEETNELLPNATFKLQYFNGSTWVDYESTGILTTDQDGFALTGNLGLGTYRFVQLTTSSFKYDFAVSKGYDISLNTVVSAPFEVKGTDTQGNKISISNKVAKYTVVYQKGDHGAFIDDLHNDIVKGTSTPKFSGQLNSNNEPLGEPGYVFVGWDNQVADIVTGDIIYTAMWEPAKYSINYLLDGGQNNVNNKNEYEYGTGVLSIENPTKNGHIFLGWYDAPENGNRVLSISTSAVGEKTLYARWEAEKYNIYYELDGGTNHEANPAEYSYGIGVSSFKTPTRQGYKFLGWYDAPTGGGEVVTISNVAMGEKTVYARWELITGGEGSGTQITPKPDTSTPTGDNTQIGAFVLLMLLSVAVLLVLKLKPSENK